MFGRKPSQRTADLARKPASGSADHRRLVAGPGHPTEPSRPLGHTRQREQEIIAAKDKAEMALEFLQTDMARVQCLPLGDTAPLWDVRYARLSASLATGHHANTLCNQQLALCVVFVQCVLPGTSERVRRQGHGMVASRVSLLSPRSATMSLDCDKDRREHQAAMDRARATWEHERSTFEERSQARVATSRGRSARSVEHSDALALAAESVAPADEPRSSCTTEDRKLRRRNHEA